VLQQLCDLHQLTLPALAERAGVPVATVRKLAAGEIRAQPGTLTKLAQALGMGPGDLARALSDARRRHGPPPPTSTQWR